MKLLIIVLFAGVVFSLGQALFAMSRPAHERSPNGVSTALTIRVGLSIALVITLLAASWFELL